MILLASAGCASLNEGMFRPHTVKLRNEFVMSDDRYVTKNELAEIFSISVRTVEANANRIPGRIKVGRSVRYSLAEIHRHILAGKNLFEPQKKRR